MRDNGRYRQALLPYSGFRPTLWSPFTRGTVPRFHHRRLSGGGLIRATTLRPRFIGSIIAQTASLVKCFLQLYSTKLAKISLFF